MADDLKKRDLHRNPCSAPEHRASRTSKSGLGTRLEVQGAIRQADPGRMKALDYLSRRWLSGG
ncbi:hypothetical protein C7U60_09485 [Mesorhizobium plurifarium]|uniref:hypothetical protein n=1 Tax=Sinorhizobium arboris TaxID=76745 RepID=UPI0005181054|nr:hypothetical protein [Sinorhizobium arboris]PST24143.1 hypothetical protein C7U60_09485 [Mesorhizobium plurifarium]